MKLMRDWVSQFSTVLKFLKGGKMDGRMDHVTDDHFIVNHTHHYLYSTALSIVLHGEEQK